METADNNPRVGILKNLIETARAHGGEVDLDVVNKFLPESLRYTQADLDAASSALSAASEASADGSPTATADAPSSETLENFEPPHANGAAPPHDDAPEATPEPMTHVVSLAAAYASLDHARSELRIAQDQQKIIRSRMANAIAKFQRTSGTAPPTPDELRRDFARQQAAERGRGVKQIRRDSVPGPSQLDRMAFYAKGDVGVVYGGHRRGAFPASRKGARVAPKIPSQA